DFVTTSDNASKMGGSQVYLKAGEQMTVSDMIKSVSVASANDCAVALAEHICGSEDAFVAQMNRRAEELGMKNTHFENVTGLDDTVKNHVTSARDIAIMSAELLKHEYIFDYTTIWMDTIRNGAFGLTNTNRLIRFYKGANGLKTGMTAKAGFCISATAKRNGMQLIAVIMGSPARDVRNGAASKLLDFGFANYGIYKVESAELSPVKLKGGVNGEITAKHGDFSALLPISDIKSVTYETELSESVSAPVKKGDVIGRIEFYSDGKPIGQTEITADEDAPKIGFKDMFIKLLSRFLMIKKS
ncbi:MAG: D-alanyl-D-alanine carboxypeptidase, partial [Clostridia bacterium]|nr:D-alanyl-D-alanine carboxypeptidase [Clostridia bacterium]